jgi:cytochrome c2
MRGRLWGLLFSLAALALAGCDRGEVRLKAAQLTGGIPDRGPALIRKYGCSTCHVIPGVRGADGKVGPSLEGIAGRVYLAGRLPNTPDNMQRWVRDPQGIERGNAMPNLGVTESDARDIAAYLYTLR